MCGQELYLTKVKVAYTGLCGGRRVTDVHTVAATQAAFLIDGKQELIIFLRLDKPR